MATPVEKDVWASVCDHDKYNTVVRAARRLLQEAPDEEFAFFYHACELLEKKSVSPAEIEPVDRWDTGGNSAESSIESELLLRRPVPKENSGEAEMGGEKTTSVFPAPVLLSEDMGSAPDTLAVSRPVPSIEEFMVDLRRYLDVWDAPGQVMDGMMAAIQDHVRDRQSRRLQLPAKTTSAADNARPLFEENFHSKRKAAQCSPTGIELPDSKRFRPSQPYLQRMSVVGTNETAEKAAKDQAAKDKSKAAKEQAAKDKSKAAAVKAAKKKAAQKKAAKNKRRAAAVKAAKDQAAKDKSKAASVKAASVKAAKDQAAKDKLKAALANATKDKAAKVKAEVKTDQDETHHNHSGQPAAASPPGQKIKLEIKLEEEEA
ncbi:MAG: hypothetical protein M1826_006596 [Phylliscum demangeonii]|nr:MAG: hypothetical protein M1826_006596 [Phylliscum demangeonii]